MSANWVRSVSATTRLSARCGSTRSSATPKRTWAKGKARKAKIKITGTAVRTGRRNTKSASRAQKVDSARGFHSDHLSIRCPSNASRAGSTSIAAPTVVTTTAMPANANERRKYCGKTSRLHSATATVAALNRMVRPAVRIVAPIAVVRSGVRTRSSRYRETNSRL